MRNQEAEVTELKRESVCVCVCVCVHACWLIWGIERGYVWPSWCLAQICHCMLDAMEHSMKISNDPGRDFVCAQKQKLLSKLLSKLASSNEALDLELT